MLGTSMQNLGFVLHAALYPVNPVFSYFIETESLCSILSARVNWGYFLICTGLVFLVTHRAPQWEERHGRGCGDATLAVHCNLGANNEWVSFHLRRAGRQLSACIPQFLVTLFSENTLIYTSLKVFQPVNMQFELVPVTGLIPPMQNEK